MKFFLALCALVAYAETPTRDTVGASPHMYVKWSMYCAPTQGAYINAGNMPAAASLCINVPALTNGVLEAAAWTSLKAIVQESNIKAQFLMRANYVMGGPEGAHGPGNCLNFHPGTAGTDNPDFGIGGAAAKDASLALVRHATLDTVNFATFAAVDCQGAATLQTTGFGWISSSTVGKTVMGGVTANPVTATTNAGLIGLAADNAHRVYATAVRWMTKKNFAFQVVGPYTDNTCTGLTFNANNINYPLVAPLEDAPHDPTGDAADADYVTSAAVQEEKAISATVSRCWNINGRSTDGGVANNPQLIQLSLTTTVGEFKLRYTDGANAARNASTGACTAGANVQDIVWKMSYDGTMDTTAQACVQAKDANGALLNNKFYNLIPAARQIGAWPSSIALPEIAATCASSPASSLHLSSALIAFFALIAMMM